jgi:hypothetical protein
MIGRAAFVSDGHTLTGGPAMKECHGFVGKSRLDHGPNYNATSEKGEARLATLARLSSGLSVRGKVADQSWPCRIVFKTARKN